MSELGSLSRGKEVITMKTEDYAHPDVLVSADWADSKQPADNNSRKTKQKSEVKLWL